MEETEEGNAAAGERKKNRGGGDDRCISLINDVLGEELLTEILIRLPTDQIFRCKSVCKHWLSLIQKPHFAAYCRKQKQRKKKQSSKLSCILRLRPHPQQTSPVLIPNNNEGLKFWLDFVPDFPQLHGANNYNDLLQQVADDKENFVNEVKLFGRLSAEKAMLLAMPDDEHKKQQIQEIVNDVDRRMGPGPQRYYSNRDFILGSSNGLLLCAPLLSTRTGSGPVFDDFAPIYVVCNPYTKQWLQVPPPPPPSPHAANVGFVSDFDDIGGGCWFKIVRLPLDLDFSPRGRRSLKLQVFSSHSWEWTTVTVPSVPRVRSPETESTAITLPSLPWPIWVDGSKRIIVAVTLKKKNGGPRLCWMLDSARAIVYDPIKNVVDAVIGVMQPSDLSTAPRTVVFDAICVSKGRLWAGILFYPLKLKIYRASGKKWEMVEEFDIPHASKLGTPGYLLSCKFMTMNPDDPRQVYLKSNDSVMLLNLRTKTLKVVGALKKKKNVSTNGGTLKGLTIVCDNPPWPTSLPSPFPSS